MRLGKLVKNTEILGIKNNNPNLDIKGISFNSTSIKKDFLFIAVKGADTDGHCFISQAIKKGAKAVVVEDNRYFKSRNGITVIRVKDTHLTLAQIAAHFYDYPSRKIKVIGISGTNGKTTVSYILERILEEAGFKTAVLGTINYRLNGKVYNCINTTPDALTIQRYLKKMVRETIDYAIMEVSSHALQQKRIDCIDFFCAIFTNFTSDHLDYHKTRKKYFDAKKRLFTMLSPGSLAIINNDDEYVRKIETSAKIIKFGIKSGDVKPLKIEPDKNGVIIYFLNDNIKIKSRLIGIHNAYNILAAVACALSLGISIKTIKRGVEKLKFIPGRLELVKTKRLFKVFVDYAHTEDGLKRVLTSLKKAYHKNRIICVFGCGGNRDKKKRPKMGRVASKLADYLIITSDNPRRENPKDIVRQIIAGIKKKNFEIILNRKDAIRKSLFLADKNTIVLIAGKGHERYQLVGNRRIPFSDKKEIINYAN